MRLSLLPLTLLAVLLAASCSPSESPPESLLGEMPADLETVTVSLTSPQIQRMGPDVAIRLKRQIVATVEIMLHSEHGRRVAELQGRTIAFDQATSQLTITDTPENIARVMEYIGAIPLLNQEGEAETALSGSVSESATPMELETATFDLRPVSTDSLHPELSRDIAQSVFETVQVLLYSNGQSPRLQGRTCEFDEDSLQVTITDTPRNMERVRRYIESIREMLGRRATAEHPRTEQAISDEHQESATQED
jgi:hypothetical protein